MANADNTTSTTYICMKVDLLILYASHIANADNTTSATYICVRVCV